MTEDEAELLEKIKNSFWEDFRWLVRNTLDRVSPELEPELRMRIGDTTSAWHPGIPERWDVRDDL